MDVLTIISIGKFAVTNGMDAVERIAKACGTDKITPEMWEEQTERWLKSPDQYLAEAEERHK